MYTSDHTLGDYFIQYEYKDEKGVFTQHINVYNPDIEIES